MINAAIAEIASNNNVIIVASAGNDSQDACKRSPASSAYAVTVGNIEQSLDEHLKIIDSSSNYGRCVDIFAPGKSPIGPTGTSFSAPRVSGALALAASIDCISNVEQAKQLLNYISVENVQRKYPLNTKKSLVSVFANYAFNVANEESQEIKNNMEKRKFERSVDHSYSPELEKQKLLKLLYNY